MTPKRRKLTRKRTLNEQFQIHHRKSYHSFKIKQRWKRACYTVKLNNNGGLTGGISRKSQLQLYLINKVCGTADCDENEATELQMTQLQMTQILQSTPVTIICMDCLLHKFYEIMNRQNNLCEPFHQVLIKKCIEKAIGNNITTTEKCLECRLRRQSDLQTSVRPSVENVKATNIMLSVSGRSFEDRCATPTAHRRTSPAQFAIYHQEHLQLIYIDLHPKGSTTLAVPCISPEIFLLKMIICSKAECLIRLLWDMYSSIKDMIGHPEANPSLNLSQDYLYTNHLEGSYSVVPIEEEPEVLSDNPIIPTEEELEVTTDKSTVPTEEDLDVLPEKLNVVPTKEEPGVLPEKPTVVPTKEHLEVTSDKSIVPTEEDLDVLPEKLTVVPKKEEPGVLPEKPTVVPTKEELEVTSDKSIVPTEEDLDVLPEKLTVVPKKEAPGVLPEKPTVVPTKEGLEVTSDKSIVPTEEELDVLPEKRTVVPTKEEPGVLPEKPTVVPTKEEPDIPFDNPIVPTEEEPDVIPQKPNVAPTKEKPTEVQAKAEPEGLIRKFTMFPTKVEHQVLPEKLATVLMELGRESLPEKPSLISTKKKSAFLRKKPILLKAGIEPTVDYQHPALVLKETVVVFLSISTKTSTPVLQEMVIVVLPQTPVVVLTKIIAAVCIGSSGVDISLPLDFHGIKYMNNGQRTSASFNPCKMYGYNNRKGQSDFMFDMRLQNHTDIVVLPAGKSPEFPQSLVPIEANTCDDQAPITSDQDQAKVQSNQLDTTLQTPVITPPSMDIQEHTQNQTSLPVPSMMRNTSNIQRQRLLEMYTTHILADTRHEDNDNTLKEGDCSTKHDDGDGAVDGLLPSGSDVTTAKDQGLLLKHGSFSDQELSDEEGRTTGNDKPSQSNIQSAEDMHLISKLNEDSLSQNPTYKVSKLLKSSTKLKLMEGYDSQGKLPDCLHNEKGTQSQTNLTSIQSQGSEKTMPSDHSQVPSNLTFDVEHISDNTMTPSDSQSHSEVTSGFSKSSYNNVTTDDSSSNNTATPPDCQSPPDLPFDVGQYSDNMVTPADEMDSDNIVMTSYSQSHSNLSNDIDQNFEYRVTPSDSQSNLSNDIDQNFEYRVTPSDLQSQSNLTKDAGQGSECKVTPSNSQSWSNLNNDADQGSEYKVTASQGLSNPPNDVGQSSENRVTLDDPQSHFHHTNCSYNIEMPESSGSDMVTLKYSGADMMMPDYFSSDNTVYPFDFQSPPDLTKDACHGSNMVTPDDSSLNNMSMPVDSGSDNMMTSHDFASYKKGTPDDSGSDNTVTYDDSQSPPNLTVRPQRHDALQTKETSKRQQPEQWPSLENCSIINSIETEGIQFRSDDSDTDSETYLKEIWQEEIGDSVNLYLDDYKVTPFSCDPGTTEEFSCDPLSGNFALIEINQMTDNEENQETQPKRYCFSPIAHDHHHQRLEDNTTHNFSSNQCGNDRCQGMNEDTHVDTSKHINTSSTSLDEQQDTRNQIVTRCSQVLPETRQHEVIRDRHVLPPSSRDVIAQPINNASDLAEEIPRAGSRITAEPNFLVLTHPNRADDFQYLGNVMEGENLIHLRHPQTGASQQQDTRLDTRGSTNVTVTICHRQRQVSVLMFPTPIDIGHLIQAIEQDENVQDILGSYPGSRRLEWEEFLTRENVWIIDHNTTIELVLH